MQDDPHHADAEVKIYVDNDKYEVRIKWREGGDRIERILSHYDFCRLMRLVVTER